MPPTCLLCNQPSREGDNLVMLTVLPSHPHWDALAANEPPGQTSVTVPACFDCRREFSIDYYGLPPEAIGGRPAWPKARECALCHLPFRQGEYAALARFLPDDPEWAEFAADEPPEQTSVTRQICMECRAVFLERYLAREGAPSVTSRHLV